MVRLEAGTTVFISVGTAIFILLSSLAENLHQDLSLVTKSTVLTMMSCGLLLALTNICVSAVGLLAGHSRQCTYFSFLAPESCNMD